MKLFFTLLPIVLQATLISALPCEETPIQSSAPVPEPTPAADGALYPLPSGFIQAAPVKEPALTPGGKVVRQRLGPYTVKGNGGMFNALDFNVTKPCTNCFVVATQAGLEYADGSEANINTGAWLHHMVMSARGPGKKDPVCKSPINIPAFAMERVWSSGNERTVKRLNSDSKHGMPVSAGESWMMIAELMNESKANITVYMTLSYEYVEGEAAAGYKKATVAWMDVGGCRGSDVPAKANGTYVLTSPKWTSTLAGKLLYTAGHMHDGGVNITIYQNDKAICVSEQLYGRKPGFIEPDTDGGHGDGHGGHRKRAVKMAHISDAGACKNFGTAKVGDKFHIVAQYDADKYPPMVHDGKLHPVMGISLLSIGAE